MLLRKTEDTNDGVRRFGQAWHAFPVQWLREQSAGGQHCGGSDADRLISRGAISRMRVGANDRALACAQASSHNTFLFEW